MSRAFVALACALMSAPGLALGEEAGGFERVGILVGGAAAVPVAQPGSRFRVGPGFEVGASFRFAERLGLRVLYQQSAHFLAPDALGAGRTRGAHVIEGGTLDAFADFPLGEKLRLHAAAGGGLYFRSVQIEAVDGVRALEACDPWLFLCSEGYSTAAAYEGWTDSTDLGLNAGLGASWPVWGVRLFLEARYHFIAGPLMRSSSGLRRANGHYVPVTLGVWF